MTNFDNTTENFETHHLAREKFFGDTLRYYGLSNGGKYLNVSSFILNNSWSFRVFFRCNSHLQQPWFDHYFFSGNKSNVSGFGSKPGSMKSGGTMTKDSKMRSKTGMSSVKSGKTVSRKSSPSDFQSSSRPSSSISSSSSSLDSGPPVITGLFCFSCFTPSTKNSLSWN